MDAENLFALQAAVADGVPREFVRLVDASTSPDRRAAVGLVLLDQGEGAYSMISYCSRQDDGAWAESVLTESETLGTWVGDRWVSLLAGKAPAGAVRATARFDGRVLSAPIANGWYLIVDWSDPGIDTEPPAPKALRFES